MDVVISAHSVCIRLSSPIILLSSLIGIHDTVIPLIITPSWSDVTRLYQIESAGRILVDLSTRWSGRRWDCAINRGRWTFANCKDVFLPVPAAKAGKKARQWQWSRREMGFKRCYLETVAQRNHCALDIWALSISTMRLAAQVIDCSTDTQALKKNAASLDSSISCSRTFDVLDAWRKCLIRAWFTGWNYLGAKSRNQVTRSARQQQLTNTVIVFIIKIFIVAVAVRIFSKLPQPSYSTSNFSASVISCSSGHRSVAFATLAIAANHVSPS